MVDFSIVFFVYEKYGYANRIVFLLKIFQKL